MKALPFNRTERRERWAVFFLAAHESFGLESPSCLVRGSGGHARFNSREAQLKLRYSNPKSPVAHLTLNPNTNHQAPKPNDESDESLNALTDLCSCSCSAKNRGIDHCSSPHDKPKP